MKSAVVRHVVAALVGIAVLAGLARPGHAQFVTYDKFAGPSIDPEKWSGFSDEGNFNGPTTEVVRILQNGSLRMTHVLWGGTTSDSGSVDHRVGLSVKQLGTLGGSGFITGVKAKVTVLDAEVQDCPANTTGFSSNARFPIQGFFFNDGTGDIIGFLNIHRDADGVNRISANLTRCSGGTCTGLDNPPGITFTTQWSLNTPVILKLAWNQAQGKFTFTVTDPATLATESKDIVYLGILADAGPPTSDFKDFRAANTVKNCSTGRKRNLIDVLVDNVKVRRAP